MNGNIVLILMGLFFASNIIPAGNIPAYFKTKFIRHVPSEGDDKQFQNKRWDLTFQIFLKYVYNCHQYQESVRIPRIIHQIWLGSELPERYLPLQETIINNHLDWEYKLWGDKEIEEFNLSNKDIYQAATNYGEKSDIARYEILYRLGGVYFDCDVECLQSFEPLNHCFDFFAGISPLTNWVTAENCIVGSSINNPVLKRCIELIAQEQVENKDMHLIGKTGPGLLSRAYFSVMENQPPTDTINVLLPQEFFFSRDLFIAKKDLTHIPHLAIHYWEGSWKNAGADWHSSAWKHYETRWINRLKKISDPAAAAKIK